MTPMPPTLTPPASRPKPSTPATDIPVDRVLKIRERVADQKTVDELTEAGFDPVLARVLAGRGIRSKAQVSENLNELIKPDTMAGLEAAADIIARAIEADEFICVVGDYDCDGATATAVTVLGLRLLGARIDYLVPNRFAHGYGLSPLVIDSLLSHPGKSKPRWIITVDNGISSHEGVDSAHQHGIGVIVTDHHLPGDTLPAAEAIVNPNVPGCRFPSKNLAGVGVAFYLVAAVRAALRRLGKLADPPPKLNHLLDLVALGTVADVVRLDENNRRLVRAGLRQMRAGKAQPGLKALMRVAGCAEQRLTVRDLGFALGPRINAAGRLEDISVGIACLLASDEGRANELAESLDSINRERRQIESDMREIAVNNLPAPKPSQMGIAVAHPEWHEGVIGLVAGRLREQWHRPVVAMAPSANDPKTLRGSGRSVPGVHLRDVFALVDARAPGLITRFGGHAMAAGLSMAAAGLPRFAQLFDAAVGELAQSEAFERELLVDGPLRAEQIKLSLCRTLDDQIWGQGFMAPVFCNEFELVKQRVVGTGHLKLNLRLEGKPFSAIFFRRDKPLPPRPVLAYLVELNEYGGLLEPQLVIQACANG
ncbi:MAG: single-stranded-DNA-specific exonuclease RecJ [Burkholderiaceae bacterium]